mmetsp:Transcript_10416/g.35982  ORF Transcript_10416/g.35982 Transcript_10416/m.35982 type:complete len:258 (-) Transcript_10416:156-929(-)
MPLCFQSDFFSLQGLFPRYLPSISLMARAKSTPSAKLTKPKPLLFWVFFSRTTLALLNEGYLEKVCVSRSSPTSFPKFPTKRTQPRAPSSLVVRHLPVRALVLTRVVAAEGHVPLNQNGLLRDVLQRDGLVFVVALERELERHARHVVALGLRLGPCGPAGRLDVQAEVVVEVQRGHARRHIAALHQKGGSISKALADVVRHAPRVAGDALPPPLAVLVLPVAHGGVPQRAGDGVASPGVFLSVLLHGVRKLLGYLG